MACRDGIHFSPSVSSNLFSPGGNFGFFREVQMACRDGKSSVCLKQYSSATWAKTAGSASPKWLVKTVRISVFQVILFVGRGRIVARRPNHIWYLGPSFLDFNYRNPCSFWISFGQNLAKVYSLML